MSSALERTDPAVWAAIQSCKWVPGTDAQGHPISIFVILPVRFQLD